MKLENCITPKYTYNTYQKLGYFYTGWNNTGNKTFLTQIELQDYKGKINAILNNSGKGEIGKVLYVGKGSNVPRHKVKVFIEENKIRKTSIIENSDTVFFDKNIIKDVYKWFNQCKEVKVAIVPFTKELLNVIKIINSLTTQTNYIKQYTDFFNNKSNMVIYYDEYSNYPQEFKQALGNLDWIDYHEQDTYRTKNIGDVFDVLMNYFKNSHGNIIWDDTILETLNSEGIDLDDDYISETEKRRILTEIIAPKAIVSVETIIRDPEYLYLLVSNYVQYNKNKTTQNAEGIKNSIKNSILLYNQTFLNKFGATFVLSKLQDSIDGVDLNAILGSETILRLQKRFEPDLTISASYVINFNSVLHRGTLTNRMTSTEFDVFESVVR